MPEHSAGISTATPVRGSLLPGFLLHGAAPLQYASDVLRPDGLLRQARGEQTTVARPVGNLPSSLSTYMNEHNWLILLSWE
jgi:hypothetical protein